MVIASLGSALIDTAGIVIVIGMASLLVYRGTRKRPEDADDAPGADD